MTDEERDDVDEGLSELRDIMDTEEDLESTDPKKAFDLWMKRQDKSESTVQSYRYRIKPFLTYLQENGIDDLSEVTTRDIKEFETVRYNANLERQTINNQFGTLRLFLQFCTELNAVNRDVAKAVEVPDLTKDDRVNTEKLITQRAQPILEELEKYEYALRDHVIFLLLWRTTIRIGALHSLDLRDIYLDEEDLERVRRELSSEGFAPKVVETILDDLELPFIRIRHSEETALKNRKDGERTINIADWAGEILEDYIRVNGTEVTDDHGRKPLLSLMKGDGRLSRAAIRNHVYILTQPCEFGGDCPHDRDPETCGAREHGQGSKCPSSRSPHKIRTGAITHHRDRGWPTSALSEKANTSEELVEGVYDQPEQFIRGAGRREFLDKLEDSE